LGVIIERDDIAQTMRIHQNSYIRKMLVEFAPALVGVPRFTTPAAANTYTQNVDGVFRGDTRTLVDFDYRSAIGILLYLSLCTRPDISNIIRFLSGFLATWTDFHVTCCLRVMRYLEGTADLGLLYSSDSTAESLVGNTSSFGFSDFVQHLEAYSDASWADDYADATSSSGMALYFLGNLIYWKSAKQHMVARSSMESEYMAMSGCVDEIKVCSTLMTSMALCLSGIPHVQVHARHKSAGVLELIGQAVKLHGDNTASICVGNSTAGTKRSRGINVKFHNVRSAVQSDLVTLCYVQSKHNRADIFTKNLSSSVFLFLRQFIVG
jgi:hypothetical protein